MSDSIVGRLESVEGSIYQLESKVRDLYADFCERNGQRTDGAMLPTPQDRVAEYFEQAEKTEHAVYKVAREQVKSDALHEEKHVAQQREIDRLKEYVDELRQWKEAVYVPPVIKFTRCVPAPTVPQVALPAPVITPQPEPAPVTTLPPNTCSPRWSGPTVSRNTCIPARFLDKIR